MNNPQTSGLANGASRAVISNTCLAVPGGPPVLRSIPFDILALTRIVTVSASCSPTAGWSRTSLMNHESWRQECLRVPSWPLEPERLREAEPGSLRRSLELIALPPLLKLRGV